MEMQSILQTIQQIDNNIYLAVYQLRQPWLDKIMPLITHLGTGGFIWLGWALLLYLRGTSTSRRVAFLTLVALIISFFLSNELIKGLVNRTRPYQTLDEIITLVKPLQSTSFPSGHTATSFACAMVLAQAGGIMRWLPLTVAVLIGISRIYVGVHYPSDVLAGALVGLLCGMLVLRIPIKSVFGRRR